MTDEIVTKAGAVKAPKKTKRYTPPKVLQPVAETPQDEAPPAAEHTVSIPPLPTAIRVEPWGPYGIILRLENVLHRGTFTITWDQLRQVLNLSDQLAGKIIE